LLPRPILAIIRKTSSVTRHLRCLFRSFGFFRSMARGVDVRPKLLVTFRFIPPLHLLDCPASKRSRGFELPGAVRAAPAIKMGLFEPYDFSEHS
jgi:hypothetical protein